MTKTKLVNPADILPPHDVTDESKFAALVESMTATGWQGAPVVVDDHHDTQALTGSHRLAAAKAADIDVPTIDIADLLAEHDHSWDDMVDEYAEAGCDLPRHEAACRLDQYLPAEVIETYGIDIH